MAQAPAPTTTIPLTPPVAPSAGASRVTIGTRSGWKLESGVIVFDDGEKVMPVSGKSDLEKRNEAFKAALGVIEGPLEDGASSESVAALRVAAARPRKAKAGEPTALELRVVARALVDLEMPRIEQLKQLALQAGTVLQRDGVDVPGNAPQRLHDRLIEAINAAEKGDVVAAAAALTELRLWSVTGAAAEASDAAAPGPEHDVGRARPTDPEE